MQNLSNFCHTFCDRYSTKCACRFSPYLSIHCACKRFVKYIALSAKFSPTLCECKLDKDASRQPHTTHAKATLPKHQKIGGVLYARSGGNAIGKSSQNYLGIWRNNRNNFLLPFINLFINPFINWRGYYEVKPNSNHVFICTKDNFLLAKRLRAGESIQSEVIVPRHIQLRFCHFFLRTIGTAPIVTQYSVFAVHSHCLHPSPAARTQP